MTIPSDILRPRALFKVASKYLGKSTYAVFRLSDVLE